MATASYYSKRSDPVGEAGATGRGAMAKEEKKGGKRYFSGDKETDYRGGADGLGWKNWAQAYVETLECADEKKGAKLYPLIEDESEAASVIKDVKMSDLRVKDGPEVLFRLFDARWPECPKTAEKDVIIAEVKAFKFIPGEETQAGIGRFRKVYRKAGNIDIVYPPAAQAHDMLKALQLADQHEAVVRGVCKNTDCDKAMAQAILDCYPRRIAPPSDAAASRRGHNFYTEEADPSTRAPSKAPSDCSDDTSYSYHNVPDASADPVEVLLAETEEKAAVDVLEEAEKPPAEGSVFYQEEVLIDALVTFTERSRQKNAVRNSRGFPGKGDGKGKPRSFDIKAISKRGICWNCGVKGPFSRDCTSTKKDPSALPPQYQRNKGKGRGYGKNFYTPQLPSTLEEAEPVPNFVLLPENNIFHQDFCLEKTRERFKTRIQRFRSALLGEDETDQEIPEPCNFLITREGYCVPDMGAGMSMVGEENLQRLETRLQSFGMQVIYDESEDARFRFGNDAVTPTRKVAYIPVSFGGVVGVFKAYVVPGSAPLLLSNRVNWALENTISCKKHTMKSDLFTFPVSLHKIPSGHYEMDVLDFREGMVLDTNQPTILESDELYLYRPVTKKSEAPVKSSILVSEKTVSDEAESTGESKELFSEDGPFPPSPDCEETGEEILSDPGDLVKEEPNAEETKKALKRSVKSSASTLMKCLITLTCGLSQFVPQLAEAVKVPGNDAHFAKQVVNPLGRVVGVPENIGWLSGRDYTANWQVGTHAATGVPDCFYNSTAVPCGDSSHLVGQWKRNMPDVTILEPGPGRHGRMTVPESEKALDHEAACLEIASLAENSGRHVMWLETDRWLRQRVAGEAGNHWKQTFSINDTFHVATTLTDEPGGIVSEPDERRGRFHRIAEHAATKLRRQRTFYWAKNAAGPQEREVCSQLANVLYHDAEITDTFLAEWVFIDNFPVTLTRRVEEPVPRETLERAIRKLHVSLGHPSEADLTRILRHGGASMEALKVARSLQCDISAAQAKPKVPRLHKTTDLPRPLTRLSMDVKLFRSWRGPTAPRIPVLNMVDVGSRYHAAEPLEKQESSEVLRKAYRNGWKKHFGAPEELLLDPASTNLGPAMESQAAWDGTQMEPTAGQAKWQNGIAERAGGVLENRFNALLDTLPPTSYEEWCEIQGSSRFN